MSFPVKYSRLDNPGISTVFDLDLPNTITSISHIYQLKRSAPEHIVEVACENLESKVFITFRNSEELIQNGYIDIETEGRKKRKYHIKLSSDQSTPAHILGMFLLTQLNQNSLIKHKCAVVVQNAIADAKKKYFDLMIELKDTPEGPMLAEVHLNERKK